MYLPACSLAARVCSNSIRSISYSFLTWASVSSSWNTSVRTFLCRATSSFCTRDGMENKARRNLATDTKQKPNPAYLHVLQLPKPGRPSGVEASASLVQLSLEDQGLVVEHRELGLQAAVLWGLFDQTFSSAQQLRLRRKTKTKSETRT